ncbi:hypothetical protein [Acidithiobacillus concretivorus]|uniref:Uncharacterized protein n=1 Tax=Acidithiobacillus concretivorus TaxID=3063952 RepID=A0ABS5ZNQ9_9PROT|nr:hypothetical protein [Acidithiobacillus concretivorus]MBU2738293.1 hypothetical protein [Acidithiobacillus concretivorus]
MTKPISSLGSFLRKSRFNVNQALFFFAVPVAALMLAQSYRRDKEIAEQIIGVKRHIDIPIIVLTPEGKREVADFETYSNLILSIPLPNPHDRFGGCFGVARKALLIAWTEIASGQDMAHAIELGRFSAFAALDATIEKHTRYKEKPKGYQEGWGFGARLKLFTERAEQNDLLKKLSSASGYPIEELRCSAIRDLATVRNVTGHCKGHTEHTETPSSRIDLRPIHLASAIISELQP